MAEHLRGKFTTLSPLTSAMEVRVDGDQVWLSLSATLEQFTSSLRNVPAPLAPPPAAPPSSAPQEIAASVSSPAEVPKPVPSEPQVIRIIGLDDGPKEIPFPNPLEVHQ